jgi:riboflavin kinase
MKDPKHFLELSGVVSSGLGGGKRFLGMKKYLGQMVGKFSFVPYQGTLNITISERNKHKIQLLKQKDSTLIKGFKEGDKTFGDVIAFKAKLKGIGCAVLLPKLSTHTNTIEIIAEKRLRDSLNLVDGQKVTVRIFLS